MSGVVDLREKLGAQLYVLDLKLNYLHLVNDVWQPSNGTIKGELSDTGSERAAELTVLYSPSVSF